MRFDPRLVQAEDAPLDIDGEIDLPDDLIELASQLSDDAAYLSMRYPAQGAASATMVAKAPKKELAPRSMLSRRQGWLIATSSALVLLVIASLAIPGGDASRVMRENAASPAPVFAADSAVPTSRHAIDTPLPELPRLPVRTAPAAMFLNGVSGPELEGLLDLWQNDHETDTRISI